MVSKPVMRITLYSNISNITPGKKFNYFKNNYQNKVLQGEPDY